jgi:hypothetical protein
MSLRRRCALRLHRAFVYHGVIKHPYGRRYAREQFTALGGTR